MFIFSKFPDAAVDNIEASRKKESSRRSGSGTYKSCCAYFAEKYFIYVSKFAAVKEVRKRYVLLFSLTRKYSQF